MFSCVLFLLLSGTRFNVFQYNENEIISKQCNAFTIQLSELQKKKKKTRKTKENEENLCEGLAKVGGIPIWFCFSFSFRFKLYFFTLLSLPQSDCKEKTRPDNNVCLYTDRHWTWTSWMQLKKSKTLWAMSREQ